jgi:putative ABC transport system substrate-binding protein
MAVYRTRIITLALSARLPSIFNAPEHVRAGALMSYGPDYSHQLRRAADFVNKILHGTRASDIPVEQPTKFELAINLTTAKAVGLKIPESFLSLADEVIE